MVVTIWKTLRGTTNEAQAYKIEIVELLSLGFYLQQLPTASRATSSVR